MDISTACIVVDFRSNLTSKNRTLAAARAVPRATGLPGAVRAGKHELMWVRTQEPIKMNHNRDSTLPANWVFRNLIFKRHRIVI